jgi:hypothetical protein
MASTAWLFAGWTDAPVVMKFQTAGCPGEAMQKLGTFELKWQGDGPLIVETWVNHARGVKPDPSSARAAWRGSRLRLSYSTIPLDPKKPQIKCIETIKLVFEVAGLPRRDYEAGWGDWFSDRDATRPPSN